MERLTARTFQDSSFGKRHMSLYWRLISKTFPQDERYGLTSQFRRAAVSIPANIAEGFKKKGRPDKARFMNVAPGSLENVVTI